MNEALLALQPQHLWRYFARLSEIPRCSKHEERVMAWLDALAKERDLPIRADAVGNRVLTVPATPGLEGAPTLVIQGHVDMVCEKNSDVDHDFSRDPIRIQVDGDRVSAEGTTLGADNGIGVATGLAMLDDPEATHGPLELLFTVDEETGLTGASQIAPDLFTGNLMLNLDSEEVGRFTIGSAGGRDTQLHLPIGWSSADGLTSLTLQVKGLRGGHSGGDIHRQRASGIKVLGRLLRAALETPDLGAIRLGALVGGSKRNAIPREAQAVVGIRPGTEDAFRQAIDTCAAEIRVQLGEADPDLEVELTPSEEASPHFASPEDTRRFIDLLCALPFGVLGLSTVLIGLVETSSNIGVLHTDEEGYHLHCSTRSFTSQAIDEVLIQMRGVARLADARIEHGDGYPGWKPDLDSPMQQSVHKVYSELFEETPRFEAIHAGLECGLFMDKYPNLQIVSYGPKITNAHSPDEWVSIASVQKYWRFTKALVRELAHTGRS